MDTSRPRYAFELKLFLSLLLYLYRVFLPDGRWKNIDHFLCDNWHSIDVVMFVKYWWYNGQFVQVNIAQIFCLFSDKIHFNLFQRFIYWRVCCFVCTREPKRRPRRPDFIRSTSHHSSYHSARPTSTRSNVRRSVRVSTRTADSGIDTFYEPRMSHAYSDTDLRYYIYIFIWVSLKLAEFGISILYGGRCSLILDMLMMITWRWKDTHTIVEVSDSAVIRIKIDFGKIDTHLNANA